ncbi:S-adenosyl-L-methionine-dependent methyltransferase [Lipomyces japonicus]|uniref:S-adenosyl-L-methionine-dependent methyltransferase n=1 Tax=Lipomyces japonicus TaxID=56871 RepID=UPI0034CEC149
MSSRLVITTINPGTVKAVKNALEKLGIFDKTGGIAHNADQGRFTIHTSTYVDGDDDDAELSKVFEKLEAILGPSIPNHDWLALSSLQQATESVLRFTSTLTDQNIDFMQLILAVPNRYSIYGKLLLLTSGPFENSPQWASFFSTRLSSAQFYSALCAELALTHVAVNAPITAQDNTIRHPTDLRCLHGDFGQQLTTETLTDPTRSNLDAEFWACTIQNGIWQTWAPRYTMFSRGNVKEKARVLTFDGIKETIVVDLYAGIGYFTFSYVKSGASLVLCWEINPWSVEGLVRGAKANKWTVQLVHHDEEWHYDGARIVVFLESNEHALNRIRTGLSSIGQNFSHVNLGLLPSSEQGWPTAVGISSLSSLTSTALHVHANVKDTEIDLWGRITTQALNSINHLSFELVHIENIKSFAPGVKHICADFVHTS